MLAGVAACAVLGLALTGCSSAPEPRVPSTPVTSQSDPTATPAARAAGGTSVDCSSPTTTVSSAKDLSSSLAKASPGEKIALAPGTYTGNFTAKVSGTSDKPITLCGPTTAVLDGGGTGSGYVFHLDNASYWVLAGFTVTDGQKGVVADKSVGSTISGLTVTHIGDEGIHLRDASTDNTVVGNTVSDTGLLKAKFGEGIYIGTAQSNWCDVSNCQPDPSDRNTIENNTISGTTAESIDIKEGTSGGVVRGNSFDGSALTGADSWVDVKGNDWLIEDNTGVNSPKDGFQTHRILDGWGTGNTFSGNTAKVNGSGVGFSLTPVLTNVVKCDNKVSGAAKGVSNVECTN